MGCKERFYENDRKAYEKKDAFLQNIYGASADPFEFYTDLFNNGSEFQTADKYNNGVRGKREPNGIYTRVPTEKAKARNSSLRPFNSLIFNDLEGLEKLVGNSSPDYMDIIAPVSFLGKRKTINNAFDLYAFVIDIDDMTYDNLYSLVKSFYEAGIFEKNTTGAGKRSVKREKFTGLYKPEPTYIVNSGNGVHLYYILKKPIHFNSYNYPALCRIKDLLVDRVWNGDTSSRKKKDYLGCVQAYRVPGSYTKFGTVVNAYRAGDFWDLKDLVDIVAYYAKSVKSLHAEVTALSKVIFYDKTKKPKSAVAELYEAGEIPKSTYKIKGYKMPWRTKVNRAFFEWWYEKIENEWSEGHRYFCVMCLAIIGIKCGVEFTEVREYAMNLLKPFNYMCNKPFTKDDIEVALRCYAVPYCCFPRDSIARLSSIDIPPNKRNHRPQRSIYVKEINKVYTHEAIDGMKFKEWAAIKAYKLKHPDAKVGDLVKKGHMEYLNENIKSGTFMVEDRHQFTREENAKGGRLGNKGKIVWDYMRDHPEARKVDIIKATGLDRKTVKKWWDLRMEKYSGGSSDTTS